MTREEYNAKIFSIAENDDLSMEEIFMEFSETAGNYIIELESKLTIAREFMQNVRNSTTVEWKELDKTLEEIK